MSIHLLSAEVASQIAAGEVVERPASVVKELMENALDSGATFISITVEGAGQKLIEVADNGCGIPAQEIPLAVERHATSKLQNADDLFHITTLGFRGEALASIGSVSRMNITSRPASSAMGARLRVEGGIAGKVEPTAAPVGTLVRVEDLFYNVPARRKFLKHDNTERRQIDALVTHYALAYPNIRFHLTQEGRSALQTSGNGNRREVLAALYGVDTARQMLEVIADDSDLQLHGFISPVALTRSNRREITFFVNGRPVQDVSLVTALLKAYHTLLMVGRYPMAVLFLAILPETVDVNVHPTKAEVRFREPERIFTGVQRAVRRALLAYTPAPGIQGELRWAPPSEESVISGVTGAAPVSTPNRPLSVFPAEGTHSWSWDEPAIRSPQETASHVAPQPTLQALSTPILRLVGQIANAYLVAEGPDGLYLIDQHAAHERVLFERFLAQLQVTQEGKAIPSQTLLQATTVDLPPANARMLAEQLPALEKLGFEVESFGVNTFLVRAIPSLLGKIDPGAALRVLVEEFEEDETPLKAEIESRLIARVCKRAAVKAGQTLSPEEQHNLLHDLERCQSPRTCPHGRPTMIHLSVDLLERQFGRRGAR